MFTDEANPLGLIDLDTSDKRQNKAMLKSCLLQFYKDWQQEHGFNVEQKHAFIAAYRAGHWPNLLEEWGPKLSWKVLEHWKLLLEKENSVWCLVDKRGVAHKGRTSLTERHKAVILEQLARQGDKLNLAQCARQAQDIFRAEGLWVPSEPTIRRFFVGHNKSKE
jgi:putative transposase